MEEFPSNSKQPKQKKAESKQVKKVVQGEVVTRKKPLGKRFREVFVQGDAQSVGAFVAFDILLPAAKDTIADVFSQGIERMLFGDARSSSRRRGGYRPGAPESYTVYNRMYDKEPRSRRPSLSREARARHDFDDVVIPTRVEAEEVVDHLFELISRFEQATVADLYDLCGITSDYTNEKWGWTDLRGAKVERVRNGYVLDLPRPEQLD